MDYKIACVDNFRPPGPHACLIPGNGLGRENTGMGAVNGNGAARLLGATLRGDRVAHGLSMRALARQIGLSAHGTLVDYEHGRRIPPEDLLVACEKALCIDDEHLLRLRHQVLAELAQ